jgi:[ribosomal protein S18]-alanine N-acetyltransferase
VQVVRPATAEDTPATTEVARAFGLGGVDSMLNDRYRALITQHGRLLVAERNGDVVGFGGMIDTDRAAMITDLFVAEDQHGHGLGRALLAGLVHDRPRRMTCSSAHPAAQGLYAAFGMQPYWRLRYYSCTVPAGLGRPDVVATSCAPTASDRPELNGIAERLQWVELLHDGHPIGHALIARSEESSADWRLLRVRSTIAHDVAIRAALSALPAGAEVECCVPEWSAATAALQDLGAQQIDSDLFMSSLPANNDGIDRQLAVINPGLA